MRSQVRKWGNSAALRLPREILAKAGIDLEQPVLMEARDGQIVVSALADPEYDLATLLDDSPSRKFSISDEDRIWLDDTPKGRELL